MKFVNFQVLRETIALCPSILVELCFLSNRDKAEYLSENSNLKALAFSILKSLIKSSELFVLLAGIVCEILRVLVREMGRFFRKK